ncbi:hypothetical protein ACFSUK_21015 [Sphingobium scionense]
MIESLNWSPPAEARRRPNSGGRLHGCNLFVSGGLGPSCGFLLFHTHITANNFHALSRQTLIEHEKNSGGKAWFYRIDLMEHER